MSKFVILGGDRRSAYLAARVAAEGEDAAAVGFEQLGLPDVPRAGVTALTTAERVILPVPVTVDQYSVSAPYADMTYPLEAVFQAIPKDALVFGGRLEPSVLAAAKRQGTRLFDYGEREDFMIANAIPTAEGTLELAMRETESTIRGSETLVLGFGRVARAVAALFHAAGARVRTAARRASDLASIAALGYEAVDIRALHGKLSGCGILVNTAPAPIMTAELLAELPKSCVVIDLASRPGGVDHTAAKQLGLKCVWALSLPGKVAPKAAGDAIWNTVRTMLREVEA